MSPSAYYPFRSPACQAEYLALYDRRAAAWPIAAETRLLDTPSGQTFVRQSGQPENPPLVLLHGARGHSLMWVPLIASLAGPYQTYAVDTIGETGRSISRRRLAKPAQLLTWLDEVLTELAPDRPVSLIGMSYGGWLAGQYAQAFPARVRRLVLLSPAATVLPVSAAMLARALLTLLPGLTFRRRFYYWLLHDVVQSGPAGRAAVDEAVADWALAERCFRQLLLVPADVLSDQALREWKTPTLYLVGEHEKVYPAHQAIQRLQRLAPQIKTALIPGAGHDLWLVRPAAVASAMLDFLAER